MNCQILRRSFATLASDSGAHLKDIQTQLRHSKTATTADIYVQPIPLSVRAAVEALDQELSQPAPNPTESIHELGAKRAGHELSDQETLPKKAFGPL